MVRFLGAFSLLLLSTRAFAASAETIETIRRQAVDRSQAGDWEGAKSSFFELFASDPDGPAGQFAIGELKKGLTQHGDADRAIARYQAGRAAGEIPKVPDWSPPGGGIFQMLDRPGQLEGFLLNALKTGGLLAAQSSLLAVLVQGMGFMEEANFLLAEAETIAKKAREDEARYLRDQMGVRPLQYRFPFAYERAGLPAYSPSALRFVPFEKALMRDSFLALRALEPDLAKTRFETHFGALLGYDSNLLDRPPGAIPTEAPRQYGFLQTYFFHGGFRSNPLAPMLVGIDFHSVYRTPPREDLKTERTWAQLPSIWVSWSDGMKNEFRVRYDFAIFSRWSSSIDAPRWSHGPGFSWARAWSPLFRTQALAYAEWKRDSEDPLERPGWPLRAGTRTAVDLAFFYTKAKSKLEPFVEISVARDRGERIEYRKTEYTLRPGASFSLWKRAWLRLSPLLQVIAYTGDGTRQDLEKGVFLDSAIPLGESGPISILAKADWRDRSSNTAGAERSRWAVQAGVAVELK